MDRIDRKIIFELQRDATLPIAELANRVGLSATPCWKRIKKLESSGVILARVAIIDPKTIGLSVTAFVEIECLDQSPASLRQFIDMTERMPEVIDVWRLTGEADYLLRVVVQDLAHFEIFRQQLGAAMDFRRITAKFTLDRPKRMAPYPCVALAVAV